MFLLTLRGRALMLLLIRAYLYIVLPPAAYASPIGYTYTCIMIEIRQLTVSLCER